MNSVGVFNTNGPIEWGGVGTGFQLGLTNGASYGTYALSIFSDTLTTLQWGVTPAGETVTKSIVVGTGTQITNHCASTQGACSMATASSCTATCSGCTTATSVCWSSPFSNAATSDAVGVKAVCSTAGTVTLTAVTASVGTETLNVFCDN